MGRPVDVKLVRARVVRPNRPLKHWSENYVELISVLFENPSCLPGLIKAEFGQFDVLPARELVLLIEFGLAVAQEHHFVAGHVARPHFDVNRTHTLELDKLNYYINGSN